MNVSRYPGDKVIVGVDEAGRGPLAGPVFAAAVILPQGFEHPWLNDSKKLSEKKRLILRDYIIENALAWAVASVDNNTIDRINILNATFEAMHAALDKLSIKPELILVDGNRFRPYADIDYKTVVGGDALYACISAASVLAKTHRDQYMIELHSQFPQYNWLKNKGYGTREHRQAIMEHGLSPYHRKSFCGFYFQARINFK